MSFSFTGIGTAPEVTGQLKAAQIGTDAHRNEFGTDLRALLVTHFGEQDLNAGAGYEYRYVVSASGYGGGASPLSLSLTVSPHWVAILDAVDTEPDPDDED
jgi:hypothetical protein